MDKTTLTNYIIKGNWNEFFKQANALADDSAKDTLISIQGRLERYNREAMLGLLSSDDKTLTYNRIVNSAVGLAGDLNYSNVTVNAHVAAALSLLMDLEYTKSVTNTTNTTVNNTTVDNITVAASTPAKNDKFDPFSLSPEVTSRIEIFMSLIRKYIILAAQVNMILPEIYDNCIEFIGELQESLMSFVTSENTEERDEILESLEEYQSSLIELETTARKEFKRAQGSEKNQVAQILKEVKVGNVKNLSLFKAAYAVFEQLDKADLVQVPKVLPANATSLGLLVKKWIRLANS